MNFLKKLNTNKKILFGSFLVVCSLIVCFSFKTYFILNDLSNAKANLAKTYELADNVSESKKAVRSSMRALKELSTAENINELNDRWSTYQKNAIGFYKNMKLLVSNCKDNGWGKEYNKVKQQVITVSIDLDDTYYEVFQPYAKLLYEFKKQNLPRYSGEKSDMGEEKVKMLLSEVDNKVKGAGEMIINALEENEKQILFIVEQIVANSEAVEKKKEKFVQSSVNI
jgi:hypothetical protein